LKSKIDELIFYVFHAIDIISVKVEIIKAPKAKGVALNTQFKFFKKIKLAKRTSRISFTTFYGKSFKPIYLYFYQKYLQKHHIKYL